MVSETTGGERWELLRREADLLAELRDEVERDERVFPSNRRQAPSPRDGLNRLFEYLEAEAKRLRHDFTPRKDSLRKRLQRVCGDLQVWRSECRAGRRRRRADVLWLQLLLTDCERLLGEVRSLEERSEDGSHRRPGSPGERT